MAKKKIRTAEWALLQVLDALPIRSRFPCDCSADILCVITKTREKLSKAKK